MLFADWLRHEGDGEIYATIQAYLKRDRHLLDWESHERSRHHGRRREDYRRLAAHFARSYSVIVLADRDYRRWEPPPEKGKPEDGHRGRVVMRAAAPGQLRREVVRAANARGTRVVEVALAGDTAWALDPKVCERLLAIAGATVERDPLAMKPSEKVRDQPKEADVGYNETR
jgi:hypothetical protein